MQLKPRASFRGTRSIWKFLIKSEKRYFEVEIYFFFNKHYRNS